MGLLCPPRKHRINDVDDNKNQKSKRRSTKQGESKFIKKQSASSLKNLDDNGNHSPILISTINNINK